MSDNIHEYLKFRYGREGGIRMFNWIQKKWPQINSTTKIKISRYPIVYVIPPTKIPITPIEEKLAPGILPAIYRSIGDAVGSNKIRKRGIEAIMPQAAMPPDEIELRMEQFSLGPNMPTLICVYWPIADMLYVYERNDVRTNLDSASFNELLSTYHNPGNTLDTR